MTVPSEKMRLSINPLTIFLAALPATIMCGWAVVGVVVGIALLFSGDDFAYGLLLMGWSAAGIYGTVSLWAVVFRRYSPTVSLGLFAGIAAFAPFTWMALDASHQLTEPDQFAIWALALSIPITAMVWLVRCLTATDEERARDE